MLGMNSFAQEGESHKVDFGTEISHIKYEEPGVMKEEGIMYGIFGSYTYRNDGMFRIESRFAYGKVDYENSGTLDNINNYLYEGRYLAGYDLFFGENNMYTPYVGIGYRYLQDAMGGLTSSTGAKGYDRESNYFYSPIGIETSNSFNNGWSIGATLEYDYLWKGRQKSHLRDARLYDPVIGYYTYNNVSNDQDKGYGIRSSMKFQKKGKNLDFGIEPYIRYWNIKKSNEVTDSVVSENGLWLITSTAYEPKNKSTEYGVKCSLKFDIPQISQETRLEDKSTRILENELIDTKDATFNTLRSFYEKGYITEQEYESSKKYF